jgi:predicted transcriptional regulator
MKRGNTMDSNIARYIDISEMLKVLAHPVRLCIIKGLLDNGECNVTYMQTCLHIPQSTLSQHLQKLRAAGIIEGTRNGLEVNYKVSSLEVKRLINIVLTDEDNEESRKLTTDCI